MTPRASLVVRTIIVVVTALAVIGLARLLLHISDILVILLIAAILATGVAPSVNALEGMRLGRRGWHPSRSWAIFLVFLAVFASTAIAIVLIVTPLVIEMQAFLARLPENLERLEALVVEWQGRFPWLPDFSELVRRLPGEVNRLARYFGPAAGVAARVFGGLASIATVIVLAVYMVVEGPRIKAGFLALFPSAQRRGVAGVLDQVAVKFGGWIRGQLLLGVIIGTAAGVGMAAVGMPFALFLAIIAGITELIPMVGPILGAIPAVFLALFQPAWKLIFVIAWYALIQQLEANFVVPRVMRRSVGLSPLLTIIALIVGAKLLGAVGALLAVPVAAALQVIVGVLVRRYGPTD